MINVIKKIQQFSCEQHLERVGRCVQLFVDSGKITSSELIKMCHSE